MLRSRLRTPGKVITSDYIGLLGNVCRRAELPFPEELLATTEDDPKRAAWFRKAAEYEQQIKFEAVQETAPAVNGKGPVAQMRRTEVLRYLAGRMMEHDERSRSSLNRRSKPLYATFPPTHRTRSSRPYRSFGICCAKVDVRPTIEAILQKNAVDQQY